MINRRPQSRGTHSHLFALDSAEWSELEQVVERFESAWRAGCMPEVACYIPRQGRVRTALALELAATDIEWRWRSGQAIQAASGAAARGARALAGRVSSS